MKCNKTSELQTFSKARTNINVIEDVIYIQNLAARTTKMQSPLTTTLEIRSRVSRIDNEQDVSCRSTLLVPQSKAYTEISHHRGGGGERLLRGTVQSARAVSPAPKSPSGVVDFPTLQDPGSLGTNYCLHTESEEA